MQIRQMSLKELYEAYDVLKQLRSELSYKEFEDLVYEMRHIEYKMFGLFHRGELYTFAGAAVLTNLSYKRHLFVFDFVTDEKQRFLGYGKMMLDFLEDYAKTAMCQRVVLSSDLEHEDAHAFCHKSSFVKCGYTFVKSL